MDAISINTSQLLLAAAALLLSSSAGAQTAIPTRQLREEMRIVSNDSAIGTSLTTIESAVVTRDGRLLTAHSLEGVIRVFDSSGRFVTMFAGRGQGPGELDRPLSIGLIGDTIWVRDLSKHYTLYAPDFKPKSQIVRPSTGGFYYGVVSGSLSLYRPTSDTSSRFPFGVYDKDGTLSKALSLEFKQDVHTFQVRDERLGALMAATKTAGSAGLMRTMTSPLGATTTVNLSPDGKELIILQPWAIWGGKPGQFTIRRMSTQTGVVSAPVIVSLAPRRVTKPDADSMIARAIERSPQIEAEYRSKVKVPEYFQPYRLWELMYDNLIWLWEPGADRWRTIVNTDGKLLMRLELPAGVRVLTANATHVWGTLPDSDGVPIIVRYRIQ